MANIPNWIKKRIVMGDCWEWSGSILPNGYGRIDRGKKYDTKLAHRLVYEALVGELDGSLVIDHICGNGLCVNPKHLEQVSQKENVYRAKTSIGYKNGHKTHCKNGHEFIESNTYVRKDRKNRRECKICRRNATLRFVYE